MLQNKFSYAPGLTIHPVGEVSLGNSKRIKDTYDVHKDFGPYTRMIHYVMVPRGASRAVIRQAVAAAMVKSSRHA